LVNLLTACASNKAPEPTQAEQAPPVTTEAVATSPEAAAPLESTASAVPSEVNSQATVATEPATTDAAQAATMPTQAEQTASTEPVSTVATEPVPAGTTDAAQTAAPGTTESAGATADLSIKRVHFGFDNDSVQDTDKPVIQAHGAYLSQNPTLKVRVEGNADERGSSEYNLALGQRRANNTKKALTLAGAKASQIEAVSFGEEKPLETGHDEAAWAQNRRVEIGY